MLLTTCQQDRQTDGQTLLPANILQVLCVTEAESLRRLCSRDPSCQINTWSNKKIKPVPMRNWLVEPIDMFPLKQVAWIYHRSGGAWSHREPVFMRARLDAPVRLCALDGRVYVFVCACACGRTACHPMGTMTAVYLWSLLAAALPNGIFLEITAFKCDTLACVYLCCWRSVREGCL